MAIEKAPFETKNAPSHDETVKIMDGMERLLNEMQEMMDIIKRILCEENRDPFDDLISKRVSFLPAETLIRVS